MMVRRLAARLAAASVVSLFAVAPAAASAAPAAPAARGAAAMCCMRGTYLQTGLRGSRSYPRAAGHAAYQSRYGHRELHVRMWNLRRLAGRILVVWVHGIRAGTMRVTRYGDAWLNRSRGVPMCRAGQVVRVRTAHGILVAGGTWRRR